MKAGCDRSHPAWTRAARGHPRLHHQSSNGVSIPWVGLFPNTPLTPLLALHRDRCPGQRTSPWWADPAGTPAVTAPVWGWSPESVGCPQLCVEPARRRGWLETGNCPEGRATGCPSTEPPSPANQRLRVSQRFPASSTMTSLFPSSTAAADLENQQRRGKGGGPGSSLPPFPPTSRQQLGSA